MRTSLGILLVLLSVAVARAEDTWRFGVTPYMWAAHMDSTLRYSRGGNNASAPDVESEDDLLDDIGGLFMLAAEARRGRWVAQTDYIYLDANGVASQVTSVNFPGAGTPVAATLNTQTESFMSGNAWTFLGGYRIYEGAADLDLLGGIRYFGLRTSSNWNLTSSVSDPGSGQTFPTTGTVSDSVNLWDGLIAVQGRVHLGASPWFLPYYVDIGGSSTNLTWQGQGGVGGAYKWLEVSLTYRYLYYGDGEDSLIQNFSFRGPSLSFTFRF